ncbi:MAG: hypothetical protein K0Q73_2801 [Paenibacillus sp.]|nr:hypothetical protein [Paenibacillus sp.]
MISLELQYFILINRCELAKDMKFYRGFKKGKSTEPLLWLSQTPDLILVELTN